MEKINFNNSLNYIEINKIDDKKRNLVVIVPGGGYDHTSVRESSFVSSAFNKEGFHTIILKYREQLDKFPVPMLELMWTIDYARTQAYVDKVIVIGFSAGAHLVGLVSNNYMKYKEYNSRPDIDILCYPVIASNKEYSHKGSFKYLLDDNMNLEDFDIAKNCHKDFPKTFLWHTADDESVPVYNSLDMVNALLKNKIKFEYHIFPTGVHGLSLATKESSMGDDRKYSPYVSKWFDMALEFIKNNL